jgi:hypothetical protein
MYVPLWFLAGVALFFVAFRGYVSIAYNLRAARRLWPCLTAFGKRYAMARFLRAKGYGGTLVEEDIHRRLSSPEAVEQCFREYTHGTLGSFFPNAPVWAAVFAQVLRETLRDGLSVAALEESSREHDKG